MKRACVIAWAIVVVQLVVPATMWGGVPTEVDLVGTSSVTEPVEGTWRLEWPEADKRMTIDAVPGGWSVEDLDTGEVHSIGLAPEDIEITLLEERGDSFVANVVVDEPLGWVKRMTMSGTFDRAAGVATATVYDSDGRVLAGDLRLEAPGGIDPHNPIIIIVGAGVAGVLACTLLALAKNCIVSCVAGCAASGGMIAAEEGPCGTCNCYCAGAE